MNKIIVDNMMYIDITINTLSQLMHYEHFGGATHNISSRLLYIILLGLSKDNIVTVIYSNIRQYTAMSNNSIAIAIKDLIDHQYIERISRGLYKII
jgi:hypothetical protein